MTNNVTINVNQHQHSVTKLPQITEIKHTTILKAE